jgi:hypothetical protein
MSNDFSTPPASNRFSSRSPGRFPSLPECEASQNVFEMTAAEPEIQPSPHFLDRGLEALRLKKAMKGAQQLAVAVQFAVQPRAADVVPVAVPGAPRTALAVAQAAVQLLMDPDMTTEAFHAGAQYDPC